MQPVNVSDTSNADYMEYTDNSVNNNNTNHEDLDVAGTKVAMVLSGMAIERGSGAKIMEMPVKMGTYMCVYLLILRAQKK